MVAAGRKSMDFDTITGAGPTLIAVPSLPAARTGFRAPCEVRWYVPARQ